MQSIESIENAVQELSPAELAKFRRWFAEFDSVNWDNQIEADAANGQLDALAEEAMEKKSLSYTYWQDESMWIGYLEDFPDYMTQGVSLEELQENLLDIHKELVSGSIPAVRIHGELQVA